MDDATRFKQQAETARDRGKTLGDREIAQAWLRIAEEYELLAQQAATMNRSKAP
jgi:hypothetical protein